MDDGDAASIFQFRRGEEVVAKRGSGRIMEAYASGSIVQYEIEQTNGDRFMADEQELRRQ